MAELFSLGNLTAVDLGERNAVVLRWRRRLAALPLLLIGLAALPSPADAEQSRPNVLLICVDDLKPTLGCFEDPHAITPHIDRLAARGVTFRKAYVNQAVCAPSRNSLLTGLRPDQIGVYDLATWFRHGAPDAVTLPQQFMRAGYHAESLGKVFHRGHGNVIDPASWSVPAWFPSGGNPAAVTDGGPKPPEGARLAPRPSAAGRPRGPAWGWPDARDGEFADGKTARRATRRLRELSAEEPPFFLAVGFVKPHLPFVVPKRYWDKFDPAKLPVHPVDATLPEGAPSFAGHNSGELRSYSDIQAVGPLTEAQARTMVHGYYAATAFVDAQIGRVLDALDELQLWDDTIVVLWGDHGWHLGDHGLWCKHTNFEQAAHHPVIIAAPGKQTAGQTSALAQTVDIYPTLCELAGLDSPSGTAGKSLVPILNDPEHRVHEAVFHVYPRGSLDGPLLGRAVRTEEHRLVQWRAWRSGEVVARELYDYQSDPEETVNLVESEEHADLVRQLEARIEELGPAKPQVARDAEKEAALQASSPSR